MALLTTGYVTLWSNTWFSLLQCSPFDGNIVATCSYDFTVRCVRSLFRGFVCCSICQPRHSGSGLPRQIERDFSETAGCLQHTKTRVVIARGLTWILGWCSTLRIEHYFLGAFWSEEARKSLPVPLYVTSAVRECVTSCVAKGQAHHIRFRGVAVRSTCQFRCDMRSACHFRFH